jgi:hypothetical protein
MGAGLVIHPNGDLVEVNLQPGENNLELMYEHLGCSTVDVVRLSAVLDMWLDEEGMFTQVVNPIATALARIFGYIFQPYFGPVLICGSTAAGDSVDLDTDQLRALLTRLQDLTA